MSAREILLFVVLSSLLPLYRAGSVLPSDCSQFSDWQAQECQNVLGDASLSTGQKEDLYLNLLEGQGKLASYGFVWGWNNNLAFSGPPMSVVPKSNGVIKDAWVKIVGVDKSFFDLDENAWFVQPFGKVLVDSNFELVLPSGVESGDCDTKYAFGWLENRLESRLNGTVIGSQRVSSFDSSASDDASMAFSAELFLKTRLQVDHYKMVHHCYCWYFYEYYHCNCWDSCDFTGSEERISQVQPTDS